MGSRELWYLAKALEGIGMVVILVGVVLSMRLGLEEDSLSSMRYEMNGLLWGGGLFLAGWVLERRLGAR